MTLITFNIHNGLSEKLRQFLAWMTSGWKYSKCLPVLVLTIQSQMRIWKCCIFNPQNGKGLALCSDIYIRVCIRLCIRVVKTNTEVHLVSLYHTPELRSELVISTIEHSVNTQVQQIHKFNHFKVHYPPSQLWSVNIKFVWMSLIWKVQQSTWPWRVNKLVSSVW